MDINADHARFRRLFEDLVRHRMKHNPVVLENDWILKCYYSPTEFEREFPSSSEREQFLEATEEQRRERDEIEPRTRELTKTLERFLGKSTGPRRPAKER